MTETIQHETFGTFELVDKIGFPEIVAYSEAFAKMKAVLEYRDRKENENEYGNDKSEKAIANLTHSGVFENMLTVQAAQKSGILLTEVNVNEVHPSQTFWLAIQITDRLNQAYETPKN